MFTPFAIDEINKKNLLNSRISIKTLETKTRIHDDFVSVSVKMPVSISKETDTLTVNRSYETKIPLRLGRVYSFIDAIVNKQVEDPDFIRPSQILTTPDRKIMMTPRAYDDNTVIYSISDDVSKVDNVRYIFVYADKIR